MRSIIENEISRVVAEVMSAWIKDQCKEETDEDS